MTAAVPYINGFVTLTENIFNTLGYLPKDQFPKLNEGSTKWRQRFALAQVVTGVALFAIGFLVDYLSQKPDKQKYLTLAQQAIALGVLYLNHGVFNLIRTGIERQRWGAAVTGAYDFYGRKFLPPLAASFDLQGRLFEQIRRQLDRIHFVTLFPPVISLRT